MATRIERILSNARLTLADPNKERWDDPTLIAILNEAQIDFCQQTQMLHTRINVPIFADNPYFELPENCWQLTRVLYKNSVIPLVTHQELDSSNAVDLRSYASLSISGENWETHKGVPAAIVYDRANMLEGKVYPIPDDRFLTFQQLDNYGVTSSVDGASLLSDYGVVSLIEDPSQDILINSSFGIFAEFSVSEVVSTLKCYFLNNPADLVDATSIPSIPSMYDIALKFYVCGQAFMNDIDTGYQQKGADQMRIYERHIRNAKKDSAHDFTRAGQFETTYRSGV